MVLDAIRGVLESMEPRRVKAERVADLIRRSRGYRWVGLYDVDRDKIAIIGWSGPGAPAYLRFPASKGLSGSAVRTRTTVVVNDVTADPSSPWRNPFFLSDGSDSGDSGSFEMDEAVEGKNKGLCYRCTSGSA